MSESLQSTAAYLRLRDEIIDCVLQPGRQTTEGELATRLGLGKAAVRVALVRLAQEGLVQTMGRRGYLIKEIKLGDVAEIFTVRAMLEAEAARLAAGRVDTALLQTLQERCARFGQSGQEVASREFRDAHTALHLTIARAAGSERLLAMLEQNMREVGRLLQLGLGWLQPEQLAEHRHDELIDALASGDAQAAELAARRHVEVAQKMVLSALYSSPEVRGLSMPISAKNV
ncbi:MAG: GntR family transcriptional regulator [Xanthomonadales bacterium]|nr:GntR family transcriptional regulator [Xanthomonadales bacterium]